LAAPFSSEYSLKSCVSYLDLRFVLTLARITVCTADIKNQCHTVLTTQPIILVADSDSIRRQKNRIYTETGAFKEDKIKAEM